MRDVTRYLIISLFTIRVLRAVCWHSFKLLGHSHYLTSQASKFLLCIAASSIFYHHPSLFCVRFERQFQGFFLSSLFQWSVNVDCNQVHWCSVKSTWLRVQNNSFLFAITVFLKWSAFLCHTVRYETTLLISRWTGIIDKYLM